MLDRLFKLQESKPWLFYLLFVPLFPITVFLAYKKYLSSSVKNTIENSEKLDKKLKEDQTEATIKSKIHREEAKKHEENIKKIDNENDPDWHKKL